MSEISLTEPHIPATEKNVVLTGFMGVGKTTIGLQIAGKLNREFIDTDEEIVKRAGMPVTEIFDRMGETAFREIERDLIVDLCSGSRAKVISLGGGAFLQEEIRLVCLAFSYVIHIALDWNVWKETRLPLLIASRPLLQDKTLAEVQALYEARRQAYSLSHLTVETNSLDPEEAAKFIVSRLRSQGIG